jgi:beta-glucosidase
MDRRNFKRCKMKNIKCLFLLLSCSLCMDGFAQSSFPFRNAKLTVEQRATDLVSRLTLEEKVAQMMNDAPAIPRLGIPAYNWWNEALHGVARTEYHVTVYPQAIGMASTWDAPLLHQVSSAISDEGRAIYNEAAKKNKFGIYHGLTYWSPNINIFRDPRWGRGQETYGEDPYLTGKMGTAFVLGLQGNDPHYLKAAACAKHFAVHSGPESNRHTFNAEISTYDLWDTYLPAFRELVTKAHVAGVMCAYNAFRTQPCCGNDILMKSILRDKWHFNGYVTSDCGAIEDFYRTHKTHVSDKSAAVDAVFHGTDVECGNVAYVTLVQAVKEGSISEKQLDVSLKRLFSIRLRLGCFDPANIVPFSKITLDTLECNSHKQLAKKMARESVVLLNNEHDMLPLDLKKMKKVVVLGPNADAPATLLGNYNGKPSVMHTPLQALQGRLGKNVELVYLNGVDYTNALSADSLRQMVERAKGADVAIFIGGINSKLEGEESSVHIEGFSGGDRTSITLPAVQTRVMKELKAAGVPVVFVLMTGSAQAIPWEADNVPAIVNAWYGGQYGGEAIADVLLGKYNPAGRLPVTFYASDEDLPDFEAYSMEGRTYRYFKGKALYPFGYGLSYTHFTYSSLEVPAVYNSKKNNAIKVSVTVANEGKTGGDEVVQLYTSCLNKNVLVPIASLKGFRRIHLEAGKSCKVVFTLSPSDLSCVDENGHSKLLKGAMRIYVGGSSPVASLAKPLPGVSSTMKVQ